MQRKFSFAVNEFYHIYNRGTEKRVLFPTLSEYEHFVALLYLCNGKIPIVFRTIEKEDIFITDRGETLADVGAYCLMPNHFHLFLREKVEDGISAFMKKLLTAYSMYFNKKNDRVGNLFEGTYKARHANIDAYLKYLFSYIHLNPAKRIDADWQTNIRTNRKKIFSYIKRYPFSSFPDYQGAKRKESVILNKAAFPNYFETVRDVERSLTDWLECPLTKD